MRHPRFLYGGPSYVDCINFTIGTGTSSGRQLLWKMAAVVNDGWEDGWQMPASGNGGGGFDLILAGAVFYGMSLDSLLGRPKCFNFFFRKMTILIDRQ